MRNSRRSAWRVVVAPDSALNRWVDGGEYGFASAEWAHVLEGLGCKVLFAWHERLSAGVVAPIFRRGPLKIGFMGFPHVGEEFNELALPLLSEEQRWLGAELGCHLMRATRCGMRESSAAEVIEQPETWIEDLATWPKSASKAKRLDKDLSFARRASAQLQAVDGISDAAAAYALYRATVLKHGGRARYNLEYFSRLQVLCASGRSFRAISYCDQQRRMMGFGVSARHAETGYYLHGAVDETVRSTGLGDLILSELISQVRQNGASRFSLMASPADQAGLVHYKKKWGDSEGYTQTTDEGRGVLGRPLAWWLHKRSRRA